MESLILQALVLLNHGLSRYYQLFVVGLVVIYSEEINFNNELPESC